MNPNENFSKLQNSYLFVEIAKRTEEFLRNNKDVKLLRLGVGDVTLPLPDAVIKAMHAAVEEQAQKSTFHGYMPECGTKFLKNAVKDYYLKKDVSLDMQEIFITSGAGDDIGNILDLFSQDNTALVIEPAYPAYVDTSIISGHKVIHLASDADCGFTPLPDPDIKADIIYICSPNNPTGAVFSREKLKSWVDYANKTDAVIIFDAAYEAFVGDSSLPRSIYEIEGSRTCAIEISSLSKTAGFTGMRCGYTVVPQNLVRKGINLNAAWKRSRTTKTNGVSYITQRGAQAALSGEGLAQCMANIALYKANAKVLMAALDSCGIKYFGGENAPYIWLCCPGGMSSWQFFDYLLEKAAVVGVPGEGFGKCGEGYFRLSAFGDPKETEEAAKRLVKLFGKEK